LRGRGYRPLQVPTPIGFKRRLHAEEFKQTVVDACCDFSLGSYVEVRGERELGAELVQGGPPSRVVSLPALQPGETFCDHVARPKQFAAPAPSRSRFHAARMIVPPQGTAQLSLLLGAYRLADDSECVAAGDDGMR
jgi:hypothetical protein